MISGFQNSAFQNTGFQIDLNAPIPPLPSVDLPSGGSRRKRTRYIPASKQFKAVLEGSESVLVELEARTERAALEVNRAVPIKGKKHLDDEKDIAILLALLS